MHKKLICQASIIATTKPIIHLVHDFSRPFDCAPETRTKPKNDEVRFGCDIMEFSPGLFRGHIRTAIPELGRVGIFKIFIAIIFALQIDYL